MTKQQRREYRNIRRQIDTDPHLTLTELEAQLQQAAMDSIVECPDCGNRMEPDAEACGECGFSNTIRNAGMI